MFKLREGPGCSGVPNRGAEDCEEGAQGDTTEEEVEAGLRSWQDLFIFASICEELGIQSKLFGNDCLPF